MDYKNTFQIYLTAIEDRINDYIPNAQPKNIYEPFRYVMAGGGKRIRPFLSMVCCGAVGANPNDAIDAGVALEILHNFTLVHDDIMDDSSIRRGRPTVHKKWDIPTAILCGDLMVGYAYKLLPKANEHPKSAEILATFTNELIEVCEGQMMDMDFNTDQNVQIADYLQMIDKKTARLLESAAAIGAYIGFGSDEEIAAVRHITRNAGIAFQIQDDLLDLTAEQATLGKKIGQDILEGKKTFLILTALNLVKDNEDKELLETFYKENGLPEDKIPVIRNMFQRIGVFENVNREIDYFFDEAMKTFSVLKSNDSTRMLKWFIELLRIRKY